MFVRKTAPFDIIILSIIVIFLSATKADAGGVTVSVFDIAPWGEVNEDGDIVGVTVDMFQVISEDSGIKFNYKISPYKRMLSELEAGTVDLSIFFRSDFSESICNQISYVHKEENVIISRKGNDLKRYSDFEDEIIALPRGVSYASVFDSDMALKKIYTLGHAHSIKLLKRGRVTAVTGPRSALIYNFKAAGVSSNALGYAFVLGKKAVWLQYSKVSFDEKTAETLAASARRLASEGVFVDILRNYFN